ncbi:hypothetical protein [Epilithonimonas vandammei]
MYDAINNKKDSHIVKFINRIKKDKSKKIYSYIKNKHFK